MDDGYVIMITNSINNLAAQVNNLNNTLLKIANNTNNDSVLNSISDALETIAINTRE